jgi:NAD+ synthase (glutamine-hydrolysing)
MNKKLKGLFPPLRELGMVRVAAAVPKVYVADVQKNVVAALEMVQKAVEEDVSIVCYTELNLTGYTCEDLFSQDKLLADARDGLDTYCLKTADLPIITIVGLPLVVRRNMTYNVAAVCYRGKVLAFIPKSYLPNYKEFKEERWFKAGLGLPSGQIINYRGERIPFGTDILIECPEIDCSFGVDICEDIWMPIPPSTFACANGALLGFNLSASNELVGKEEYRRDFVVNPMSSRCYSSVIYVSAGQSESTSATVFGGHCIISENGAVLAEKKPLTGDAQLLIADVDVDKLSFERRSSNTWRNWAQFYATMFPYRQIYTDGRIS